MRPFLAMAILRALPARAADPPAAKAPAGAEGTPAPLPAERGIRQSATIGGGSFACATTPGAIPVVDDEGDDAALDLRKAIAIDRMPAFGRPNRMQLALFAGGHMFYSRPASTAAFRRTALSIYR